MIKKIVNLPASIHQKLLNLARSTNRIFNELLYIYTNERFLYRLSKSTHASKFILKGAMAILNLEPNHPRYTRDVDLLGYAENSTSGMEEIIRDICETPVIDDGLVFDPSSIKGELIKVNDEYPGVRVRFNASLGSTKIKNLQVDVGVGDAVYPQAKETQYHGLLDFPEAVIRIYQPETILAEKIHALVKHGLLNSRMKDIYDIWLIASNQSINGAVFSKSLKMTFKKRVTPFPETLVIFEERYVTQGRKTAWKSIERKLQSVDSLPELSVIIESLESFITPVMDSLYKDVQFSLRWDPKQGWL
jgi:predicted nucleotidyltransferase component of viral defense system